MTTAVIYGKNLIRSAKYTDLSPSFVETIDPKGWTIVAFPMLHNDVEIRALMLFKVKGVKHPVEFSMTIDLLQYNKIVQHVDPSTTTVMN